MKSKNNFFIFLLILIYPFIICLANFSLYKTLSKNDTNRELNQSYKNLKSKILQTIHFQNFLSNQTNETIKKNINAYKNIINLDDIIILDSNNKTISSTTNKQTKINKSILVNYLKRNKKSNNYYIATNIKKRKIFIAKKDTSNLPQRHVIIEYKFSIIDSIIKSNQFTTFILNDNNTILSSNIDSLVLKKIIYQKEICPKITENYSKNIIWNNIYIMIDNKKIPYISKNINKNIKIIILAKPKNKIEYIKQNIYHFLRLNILFILFFLATIISICILKKIIKKQTDESKTFKNIIDNMCMIITIKRNGEIIHSNKKFKNQFNIKNSDNKNISLLNVVSNSSMQKFTNLIKSLNKQNSTILNENITFTNNSKIDFEYLTSFFLDIISDNIHISLRTNNNKYMETNLKHIYKQKITKYTNNNIQTLRSIISSSIKNNNEKNCQKTLNNIFQNLNLLHIIYDLIHYNDNLNMLIPIDILIRKTTKFYKNLNFYFSLEPINSNNINNTAHFLILFNEIIKILSSEKNILDVKISLKIKNNISIILTIVNNKINSKKLDSKFDNSIIKYILLSLSMSVTTYNNKIIINTSKEIFN